jgi:hypothetical protein
LRNQSQRSNKSPKPKTKTPQTSPQQEHGAARFTPFTPKTPPPKSKLSTSRSQASFFHSNQSSETYATDASFPISTESTITLETNETNEIARLEGYSKKFWSHHHFKKKLDHNFLFNVF